MTVFTSNCTLPPNATTFVSAAPIRGTSDILWSCLSVLIICTWSVIHLNVPIQSTPRNKRQKYTRAFLRTRKKTKWMLINLLAPEWAFAKAWVGYRSVSQAEKDFKKFQESDDVPWTRSHIYYANMGGFRIKFDHNLPKVSDGEGPSILPVAPNGRNHTDPVSTSDRPEVVDGITHTSLNSPTRRRPLPDHIRRELDDSFWRSNYNPQYMQQLAQRISSGIGDISWELDNLNVEAVSEAFETVQLHHFSSKWEESNFRQNHGDWDKNLHSLQGDTWILDAYQLLLAREFGIIEQLPNISEDEIDDRNKADLFVKVIAFGQVLWFGIQLCARLGMRIATSQLEILTLAFAACTGVTYILSLDKPKDAQVSVKLAAQKRATPEQLMRIAVVGPGHIFSRSKLFSIPNDVVHVDNSIHSGTLRDQGVMMMEVSSCALIIFGAIHCIAWDFIFPTYIEKVLWHVSSIITIAIFPTLLIAIYVYGAVSVAGDYFLLIVIVTVLSFTVFVAARLFILVEVCRSLAFLPAEAFLSTCAANFPHIG